MKKLFLTLTPAILLLLALSGCDKPLVHEHTVIVDKAVAATCETPGKTTGSHCGTCNEVLKAQKSIPANGHAEVKIAGYEASCTAAGLTDGVSCSVCNKKLVEQYYTPKLGHHVEVDSYVMPSCTTPGLTMGSHCKVCQTVITPQEEVPPTGHKEKIIPAVAATCQSVGLTEGKACYVCGIVTVEQKETALKDHRAVKIPAVEATCQSTGLTEGSKCGDCDVILKAQKTVSKTGHKSVTTPAVEGTCVSKGLSEGSHCKYCKKVLIAQKATTYGDHVKTLSPAQLPTQSKAGKTERYFCSACGEVYIESYDPDRYNGRYGFEYLGTLKNGKKLQTLYDRIDVLFETFHMNAKDAAYVKQYDLYISEYLQMEDLKLNKDELDLVLKVYTTQHALYYWYSGIYYYSNANDEVTKFAACVMAEYADGAVRQQQNLRIYQTVQNMAVTSSSAYTLAKRYHDEILENMYYSYEADGVTPNAAEWAHSVIGYVEYGAGVCETYTEMFHMMLCFSGVESIRVHGYGGGDKHVWNLAKMDDGKWYWFDLTWDDGTVGYNDRYFCISETETILYTNKTFVDQHTYDTVNSGSRFQVPLPERSQKKYK